MPHGQVVECKGTLFIHTPLFPFCLSVVILRSEDYATRALALVQTFQVVVLYYFSLHARPVK